MKKIELMEHHENSGNEEQADMYQAVHAVWAHIAWITGFSHESRVSNNIGHILRTSQYHFKDTSTHMLTVNLYKNWAQG